MSSHPLRPPPAGTARLGLAASRALPCLALVGGLAAGLATGCERVSVTEVDVSAVGVSPARDSVRVGETTRFTATVTDAGGNVLSGRMIQWSSGNEEVAVVESDGTASGISPGTVMVRATAGGVTGTAELAVLPGAVIRLDPGGVSFEAERGGPNPSPRAVSVTNGGPGTLTQLEASIRYGDGEPAGWLNAALSGATAPATLTLSATLGALAAATYTATVSVTSERARNSPQTVDVTLRVVEPPPAIGLSRTLVPMSATFGATQPAVQTVEVTNSGGGSLDGLEAEVEYLDGSEGWLFAELDDPTAPTVLRLRACASLNPPACPPPASLLLPGEYEADVHVTGSASNSPQTVRVTFEVR